MIFSLILRGNLKDQVIIIEIVLLSMFLISV